MCFVLTWDSTFTRSVNCLLCWRRLSGHQSTCPGHSINRHSVRCQDNRRRLRTNQVIILSTIVKSQHLKCSLVLWWIKGKWGSIVYPIVQMTAQTMGDNGTWWFESQSSLVRIFLRKGLWRGMFSSFHNGGSIVVDCFLRTARPIPKVLALSSARFEPSRVDHWVFLRLNVA